MQKREHGHGMMEQPGITNHGTVVNQVVMETAWVCITAIITGMITPVVPQGSLFVKLR